MNIVNRKQMLRLTMALLLSAISISAWSLGLQNKYNIAYDDCVNSADRITNGVIEHCSGNVTKQVAADMQTQYDIVLKKMMAQSFEDAKRFEGSQAVWLKYRDSHCSLMGAFVGSPEYSVCPLELSKLRVFQLTTLAE